MSSAGAQAPAPAVPLPPEGLGEAGGDLWRAIVGDVEPAWRLDARDLALLRRACGLEDVIAALEAVLDRDGATARGSKGQTRVHPAIGELRGLVLAQRSLFGAIELEDPAAKVAEARARTAARTSEWRRRTRLREAG